MPLYSEPASEARGPRVMKEIREGTTKRGLQRPWVTDEVASKEVGGPVCENIARHEVGEDVHDQFRDNMGLSRGETSGLRVWARRLFCEDPSVSRSHGWRLNVLSDFPRSILMTTSP